MQSQHKKLSAVAEQVHRYISQPPVLLAESDKLVTITRTGTFHDPRYGEFEITPQMLSAMVSNFNNGVLGQDVFLDVDHDPGQGAAAKVTELTVDNGRLRARVDWTAFGESAVRDRGFSYLSAEYHENWRDNETGQTHGPVLMGAALTNRPVIKRLDPIQLSEKSTGGNPTGMHPDLFKKLSKEVNETMEKLLKEFRAQLEGLKLSETVIKGILDAYEAGLKLAGEDEAAQKSLTAQYETMGKQLAEATTAGNTVNITLPEPPKPATKDSEIKALTADDITKLLDEREQSRVAEQKRLADQQVANRKLFADTINASDKIDDDIKKQLCESLEMITAEMSDAVVKVIANQQIKLGEQQVAAQKLSNMGFNRAGNAQVPHITVDESNKIKELQETIDRRLGYLDTPDSRRFAATGGQLQPENKKLADAVLKIFDAQHARNLYLSHDRLKKLAAGDTIHTDSAAADVEVWERTVIREALYQLIALQFVDSGALPFATSYPIPYSYRDTTAAGINDTRKYEGQAVSNAQMVSTHEIAYPFPQKLATLISDEMRYLTASNLIDWDAAAENTRNAVRIIGEDTERLIFNEILQANDEYLASVAAVQNLELQADDTLQVFVLDNFPVVRPRVIYDLKGSQVGSTVNPIVVTYDSVARSEYDGTGTQAAGIYYVLDYNLGEIYLVNEAGVVQTPANGTVYTIGYSHTSNVYKFDSDLGSSSAEDHYDTFLYRFGLRKNVIEDDRYHMANFFLGSGTLMTTIEQAKSFKANFTRPGTSLNSDGNLGMLKMVPGFRTTAPGLHMGDMRMLIGERFQTRYRLTKPWSMGELENKTDSNGNFIGKKQAYGDQFSVLHTPTQLKRAMTSILHYSASARVARVAS